MSSNLWLPCSTSTCISPGALVIPGLWLCEGHEKALRTALLPDVLVPDTGAVVYYISWRGADTVKIGTTTNLPMRTRALSRSGRPARVLVAEPGSYYLERKRHRQFASLRAPGSEEFRWAPLLSDHIDNLRRELRWRPS